RSRIPMPTSANPIRPIMTPKNPKTAGTNQRVTALGALATELDVLEKVRLTNYANLRTAATQWRFIIIDPTATTSGGDLAPDQD
ncbi:MAG: hypothetical protein WCQ60_03825, partial [bacterium]